MYGIKRWTTAVGTSRPLRPALDRKLSPLTSLRIARSYRKRTRSRRLFLLIVRRAVCYANASPDGSSDISAVQQTTPNLATSPHPPRPTNTDGGSRLCRI